MTANVQPVTFYVPSTAELPIDLNVAHSGLRMVLVNRGAIRRLGDEWKVLGVYFLLGPDPGSSDRFLAYVGEVGRRNLVLRLSEHAAQKAWWNRALLIASNNPDGFNSAEIGWLEGRLYDVLNNAVAATLMNNGRPGDDSIAIQDRGVLERYVEPTIAALRAVGASPDTADQQPPPLGKKRAYYRESVKDLIDADLLKPGTRLRPLRKYLTTTALVLDDGRLEVGSARFSAVSAAAVAVSGNQSEPGWEFWGAPSGDGSFASLFDLRDRLRADHASSPKQSGATASAVVPTPRRAHGAEGGDAANLAVVRRKRHYGDSVRDLIDAGLLAPGQDLEPTRRGKIERATVLESGRLELGGKEFETLSAAAKAVSGNSSEPGWEFWAVVERGHRVTLFDLRARLRASVGRARPTDRIDGDSRAASDAETTRSTD